MKLNLYQKTALSTIAATLFLIMVGGIVRAAGAGLGCPDWPKCYGLWIPPMHVSELPPGFDVDSFNAFKTWTEYINRLIGVLVGFFIAANFLTSLRYRKSKPDVTISSLLALILVLFQAWLGGQVVRSGLASGMITLHMILAMIIVGVLLYASFKSKEDFVELRMSHKSKQQFLRLGIIIGVLSIIQMILGTQVREAIDLVNEGIVITDRSLWIEHVGVIYKVHRSFSWLLIIAIALLSYRVLKFSKYQLGTTTVGLKGFILLGYAIPIGVLSQFIIGVGLQWFDMPRVLQVLHLVGVTFLLSFIFIFVLMLSQRTKVFEVVDS
ncbi:MAG: COX15/CtaA family protein [Bacteroidota bacterium]|nr:COX15/CtaA family protein [Bacteroidota bacterium]